MTEKVAMTEKQEKLILENQEAIIQALGLIVGVKLTYSVNGENELKILNRQLDATKDRLKELAD